MKHRTILLVCASIIFNFQFSTLNSQELPQDYFRNPLDGNIGLSATFAEFRANHFHGGLDMRTGGATGKPVRAAADGYVAKVSISPWGGGKILYIKHPNGYTTVYMHLDGYAGAIGKAVEAEQYRTMSYSISKLFAPNELPVKKGQLVAYSGNTGGSGGPHLHFEVRRGGAEDLHTGARLYNPLHFGLPYTDNIKPTIRDLRIYPVGGEPFAVDKENTVNVGGPFYLGIYATDAAEGSTAKNGVEHLEVYLDGKLFFKYTTDSHVTDSSRIVNALIDFPLFTTSRQAYLLTRALPGAKGEWIPVCQGDGIFRLPQGTTHTIAVKVYDIKGNRAERVLKVTCSKQAASGDKKGTNGKTLDTARYDQKFLFNGKSFLVEMQPHTLYADDLMRLSEHNGTVTVEPTVNIIPPHLSYTLSISNNKTVDAPTDKITVVRVDGKRPVAYKTRYKNGRHTASVRDFGRFTLAADTTAPVVQPINFADSKPLKSTTLKVKISDDLSGIEDYHCYMNGSWILAEYDGKTATLTINADGKLRQGTNEFIVDVTDGCGNISRKTYNVLK